MGLFVRAVINGFGFSLGKFLFDVIKERITGEGSEPQRVVVENVTDFQPPPSPDPESSPN
jgi:hypothetical protein